MRKFFGMIFGFGAVFGFIVLCGMGDLGEVREHREEIRTLKEQSLGEAAKEKQLAEEEASFQSIRAALAAKTLATGAASKSVAKQYGKPIDVSPEGSGKKWLYRSRHGQWLERPWLYLYFDEKNTLVRWECFHTDCGA